MMGNNKLSFFEIRIGWDSPGKYPPPSEWLLSYDRTMKRWEPAYVSKIITVIGFYILITLRRDTKKGSGGKQDLNEIKTVQSEMLEDAEFVIASEDSEFDIWITTSDGRLHGFIAKDAIQLSTTGGKGPDRLRDWLTKEWFFREYVQKPNQLIKGFHNQPDDGSDDHKTGSGDNGKGSKST